MSKEAKTLWSTCTRGTIKYLPVLKMFTITTTFQSKLAP